MAFIPNLLRGLSAAARPPVWQSRVGVALLAVLLSANANAGAAGSWPEASGRSAATGANVPQDVDGDLLPDLVYCADYDDDGALEMADVRLCVGALTDTGDKTVAIMPGNYAAPADPEVDYPAAGDSGEPAFGLIDLPSNMTLTCITPRACKLNNATVGDSGQDYAVISNEDHTTGNTDIVIEGLEIDGAEGDDAYSGTSLSVNQRMGIFLRGTTGSRVENNFVHDTHHTCIYTSNSTSDTILNNRVDDCGGAEQTSGTTIAQPGIYLFATGSHSTSGTRVIGNRISKAKGNGINTRVNAATDSIVDIEIANNYLSDGVSGQGYAISIRGVDGADIRGNTSLRYGGGLTTYASASVYYSSGATNFFESSRRLNVHGNTFKDSNHATTQNAGIYVGPYLEDSQFVGNIVDGTTTVNTHCLVVKGPERRVRFDGFKLSRCAGYGLTDAGTGSIAGDQAWVFTDLSIEGTDWIGKTTGGRFPGIFFQLAHDSLVIREARIAGATDAEIQFGQSMTNGVFENILIDSTDPGYLGFYTVATLPTCNSGTNDFWAVVDDATGASDCTTGGSTTDNACFCNGSAWANFSRTVHESVEFADGSVDHASNRLVNWTVKNATNNDATVNPYVILTDGSGYELRNIACVDDSRATTTASADCIRFVTADNGPGEFTGVIMVGVRNSGLTNADSIAIDEGAGGDDLFSTEFSYIHHRGTGNPTSVVFASDACGTAYGSEWIDGDASDDPIFMCETGNVWVAHTQP